MDMEKVLLLAEMATYTCYLDSSRTQVAETKDFRLELDLRFGVLSPENHFLSM